MNAGEANKPPRVYSTASKVGPAEMDISATSITGAKR